LERHSLAGRSPTNRCGQGADLAAGLQLALKDANNTVMGRNIEVTRLDESAPQSATQNDAFVAGADVHEMSGG
jgi:hypothetical protein